MNKWTIFYNTDTLKFLRLRKNGPWYEDMEIHAE